MELPELAAAAVELVLGLAVLPLLPDPAAGPPSLGVTGSPTASSAVPSLPADTQALATDAGGVYLAGGVLGGLIGNRIGASLDDEDKERAYAAQMDALDKGQAGAPVSWRNPDSGRYGTVVPGPAYQQAGRNCRSFTHTIYIDGQPQTARGTACRNPDGTWTAIG